MTSGIKNRRTMSLTDGGSIGSALAFGAGWACDSFRRSEGMGRSFMVLAGILVDPANDVNFAAAG
jgi:hypothetical protein